MKTVTYYQSDYGTERLIVVRDENGKQLGACDPFWPNGVPKEPHRQFRRIGKVCAEIIADESYRVVAPVSPVVAPLWSAEIEDGRLVNFRKPIA